MAHPMNPRLSNFTDTDLINELRARGLTVFTTRGRTNLITNMYEDVGEFHEKMKLPRFNGSTSTPPRLLTAQEYRYRVNFMHEELDEFVESWATGDLAQCADALADLVWVTLGTAHYMHLPFDQVWAEVRRANLEKRPWQEGDPIKARNYTAGEVVKPLGWRGPDIGGVLAPYYRG